MSSSVVASARGCFLLLGDYEKSNGSSIFLFTRKTLHLSVYLGGILITTCRSMFVGGRDLFVVFSCLLISLFYYIPLCCLQIERSLSPFLLGDHLYIAQTRSGPIHCPGGFHWLRYSIPTEPRLLSIFVFYYLERFLSNLPFARLYRMI